MCPHTISIFANPKYNCWNTTAAPSLETMLTNYDHTQRRYETDICWTSDVLCLQNSVDAIVNLV